MTFNTVPAARMVSLADQGLPGVRAFRTHKTVFGVERTVLVIFNQELFNAKTQTLLREIGQRRGHLRSLQAQLRRWRNGKVRGGRKPTLAATRKRIQRWLAARHMSALCCVLALALCCLLQRQLARKGIDGSIPALLRQLAGIQEVEVVYLPAKKGAKPQVRTTLTKMNSDQQRLLKLLRLDQYTV